MKRFRRYEAEVWKGLKREVGRLNMASIRAFGPQVTVRESLNTWVLTKQEVQAGVSACVGVCVRVCACALPIVADSEYSALTRD